jgi:hypothetical protein
MPVLRFFAEQRFEGATASAPHHCNTREANETPSDHVTHPRRHIVPNPSGEIDGNGDGVDDARYGRLSPSRACSIACVVVGPVLRRESK